MHIFLHIYGDMQPKNTESNWLPIMNLGDLLGDFNSERDFAAMNSLSLANLWCISSYCNLSANAHSGSSSLLFLPIAKVGYACLFHLTQGSTWKLYLGIQQAWILDSQNHQQILLDKAHPSVLT
jgi:hypothetical protein